MGMTRSLPKAGRGGAGTNDCLYLILLYHGLHYKASVSVKFIQDLL